MRGWFFIIISILLIPFVFAADNLLQDEDYNKILAELENGEITTESISIISHYGSEGISSETQKNFVDAIGELKEGTEKVFWESFWKLSPNNRASFINSFKTESKNELLNIFSNQYIRHTRREDPILEFNLKGDVDVKFIKTKEGNEFLVFGDKYILLDWFKESDQENGPYTIEYTPPVSASLHGTTDTIVKTHGEDVFSIKGGKIILGKDIFYVLDSDNKLDKSHALSGMTEIHGNIALDLTGEEYQMSINSYEKGEEKYFSSVELKNGMRISSIKEFDKTAEIIFDKEGEIKSIENLKINFPLKDSSYPTNPHIASNYYYETINGKMRFISDVEGFLDSNGKIDSMKIKELMLEGGKESKYDGYFVFDKKGGENGKPFIAAVTEGVGIREFGRLTNEALQRKKLDTIGKLFGGDTQEQKTGSMLSSLNKQKLDDINIIILGLKDLIKAEKFFFGKKSPGIARAKIDKIARAKIDEALKPLLGDDYQMTDIDYEVFSNTEFLNSVQNAVGHFQKRLGENPKYFERYDNEKFKLSDFSERDFASQSREDFDSLIGVIGKVDSIYDALIPKSTVTLGGDVGTLVVGGNTEVLNDDLKITENLDGVSFGSKIISEGDAFNIRYPIDKIYTTNNENIWNIRKNSEGGLEPFMVGGKKSNVVLTRLDILHQITAEEAYAKGSRFFSGEYWGGTGAWIHDAWSKKSQEIAGRVVKPATISFKVPSETAGNIARLKVTLEDGTTNYYSTNKASDKYLCPKCIKNLIREGATISGAVEYYDTLNKGPYELSATFHSRIDPTGKSQSGRINREANIQIANALGESRTMIGKVIDILNSDVDDSFAKEKALVNLVKQEKDTIPTKKVQNVFFQDLMVDSIMKIPNRELVQLGVDFTSKGYTSYGDIQDVNSKKISSILDFVDTSLEHLQNEYYGGLARDRTITLVKKENNDLFLKDSYGNTLSIDSEIEPFVARLIPLLTSQAIKKSQNQVLNQKNYRFPGPAKLYIQIDPDTDDPIFSPNPP